MEELKEKYNQLITRIEKIDNGAWCEKLFIEHELNDEEKKIVTCLGMLDLLIHECHIPRNVTREVCFCAVLKRVSVLVEEFESKGEPS